MATPSFSSKGTKRAATPPPAAAPVSAAPRRYVAVKSFTLALHGAVVRYDAGRVIEQPYLIDAMLGMKMPIKPVDEAGTVACCPHCHKTFVLD